MYEVCCFPFETGMYFRGNQVTFPKDTFMSYAGFEPGPTHLSSKSNNQWTSWASGKLMKAAFDVEGFLKTLKN